MGTFTVGSVVSLAFPYADFSRFKNRPAIVVGLAEFENLSLCQITSQKLTSKIAIPISDKDFSNGSLQIRSFARPDKLFTVEASIIQTTIGQLTASKKQEILAAIRQLFTG